MGIIWWRQTAKYHPVIGWWYISNLNALIGQRENPHFFRTNSLGMRSNREYPMVKPHDRIRIALLGDSYTAGHGVSNGSCYSDVLENSYPNLDVMNFGLGASGTDQQLLVYENFAKAFDADAYIFAPHHSNIVRNQSDIFWFGYQRQPNMIHGRYDTWYASKPYFTLEREQLVLHNVPVPNIPDREFVNQADYPYLRKVGLFGDWGLEVMGKKMGIPQRILRSAIVNRAFVALAHPHDDYSSEKSQSWKLTRAIIERFIRQVKRKPVFIAPLPDTRHFLMGLAPTYLARFKELNNVDDNCFLIDVLQYFKRLSSEDRSNCCLPNDPHYSPLGHRVVAQAISDSIARHWPELLE